MLEHRPNYAPLPVSHWARQPAIDSISAVDALGGVVMTIITGPGFSTRLAAAFHNRPPRVIPREGV